MPDAAHSIYYILMVDIFLSLQQKVYKGVIARCIFI